jgi:hypothetical protein
VVQAPRGDLGDLGDVTDPSTLRALLAGGAERREQERAGGGSTAPDSSGGAEDASGESSTEQDAALAPTARSGGADPGACAAQLAGSRPVRFVGTGTYEGQAVVVVGLDQGGRTIALVVPAGDCTSVLTSVSR